MTQIKHGTRVNVSRMKSTRNSTTFMKKDADDIQSDNNNIYPRMVPTNIRCSNLLEDPPSRLAVLALSCSQYAYTEINEEACHNNH